MYEEKDGNATHDISYNIEILMTTYVKLDTRRCGFYVSKMLHTEDHANKTVILKEIIKECFDLSLADCLPPEQPEVFLFRYLYVNGKFSEKEFKEYVQTAKTVPCSKIKEQIKQGSIQVQEKFGEFRSTTEYFSKQTFVKSATFSCRKSIKTPSENYFNGKFTVRSLFNVKLDLEFSVYYKLPNGDRFGTMNRIKFRDWSRNY